MPDNFVDIAFYIVELIGTVAFAISGAMLGIERKLDLFGVIVLGVATAIGGGIIRDMMLGQFPPKSFLNFIYFGLAAGTSIIVFLCTTYNRHREQPLHGINDTFLNFCDAAGLGIFSVIGVQNTINAGFGNNMFFCVFLGMMTGVGGGILRDVLSQSTPAVLRKQIYALASIGASIFYYLVSPFNRTIAIISTILLTIVVRMLAARYRWKLPKVPPKQM